MKQPEVFLTHHKSTSERVCLPSHEEVVLCATCSPPSVETALVPISWRIAEGAGVAGGASDVVVASAARMQHHHTAEGVRTTRILRKIYAARRQFRSAIYGPRTTCFYMVHKSTVLRPFA